MTPEGRAYLKAQRRRAAELIDTQRYVDRLLFDEILRNERSDLALRWRRWEAAETRRLREQTLSDFAGLFPDLPRDKLAELIDRFHHGVRLWKDAELHGSDAPPESRE